MHLMLLLLLSFLHASLVKQVQAKLWFMIKVKGQGQRCLEVDRDFSQRQFTDGFNLQEKVIFLHNRLAPQLQKKRKFWHIHHRMVLLMSPEQVQTGRKRETEEDAARHIQKMSMTLKMTLNGVEI